MVKTLRVMFADVSFAGRGEGCLHGTLSSLHKSIWALNGKSYWGHHLWRGSLFFSLPRQAIKLSNTVSPRLKLKRLLPYFLGAPAARYKFWSWSHVWKKCTLRVGTSDCAPATSAVCTKSAPHVCQRSQKHLISNKSVEYQAQSCFYKYLLVTNQIEKYKK